MTLTSISGALTNVSGKARKTSVLAVIVLVAAFTSAVPAHAQNGDTWKSVAIIGGSTAAGAYIGHRIGGATGTYVGAAVGAGAGYAIDRYRRHNEYNNQYSYGNGGNYGGNGGYYGNNDPYYGNGGYYGGPDSYPSPPAYPGNGFKARR